MAEGETQHFDFNNERLGGAYRFERAAYEAHQKTSDTKLTRRMMSWIIGEHIAGIASPLVTLDVIERVRNAPQLSFSDRVRRLFYLISLRNFQPSDNFRISGIVDAQYRTEISTLSEWLDLDEGQISSFFMLTEQMGLTKHANNLVHLTAKGFERLDELRISNVNSIQAFVAMWFDSSLQSAFENGIEPAIRAAGYNTMRIDRKEHNNKIDDEIIAEIKRSKFVVADFTCEKFVSGDRVLSAPRGGVYFEAGFAQGMSVPVIWMCRRDLLDYVHFDTRQFSHIVWDAPDDLQRSLYNRICATIGENKKFG